MGGGLLTFDPRVQSAKPVYKCKDTKKAQCVTSLSVHPDRPNMAATGTAEGYISVWDVRLFSKPTCTFKLHSSTVWDLAFIPSTPTLMVSCSEDGSVQLCNFNSDGGDPIKVDYSNAQLDNLSTSAMFGSSLGVNSIDIDAESNSIVCGTDGEELLILPRFTV